MVAAALALAGGGIVAAVGPASAADYNYRVTATIGSAGSEPSAVAVDPTTDTVYVADESGNTVTVIDGETGTVTATIGVGTVPQAIAVDASTDTVYVANLGGTVSVIDGATDTVTATITVGITPDGVAVDPVTHTVYVSNQYSGTVSVIDAQTNTVTKTISGLPEANPLAVNPVTDTIYVAHLSTPTVSVINGATDTVTATITVGSDPDAVAVDPTTNTVYVTNGSDTANSMSVINGATNTVTATIGVGSLPLGIAVDPATHNAYVPNSGDNTISVISPVLVVPTMTTLSSSTSSPSYGQPVTFTATVAPTSPGSGTPTGTVTFRDGSTVLGTGTLHAGSGGDQASLTTTALPGGSYTITASYSGDSDFTASTSSPLHLTVQPAPTTLRVDTSLLGPFQATLTRSDTGAPIAGQKVVFTTDTGQRICAATTGSNGVAACNGGILSTAIMAIGYHATYAGGPDYRSATGYGGIVDPILHSLGLPPCKQRSDHTKLAALRGPPADFKLAVPLASVGEPSG
jgi:YVTN family beta-propeller protein